MTSPTALGMTTQVATGNHGPVTTRTLGVVYSPRSVTIGSSRAARRAGR